MNEKLKAASVRLAPPQIKTVTLGVLTAFTPEIFRSEYYRLILSGITAAAACTPCEMKLALLRDEEKGDLEKILSRHALEGVLILTWRIHAPDLAELRVGGKVIPSVVINDFVPGLRANVVYTDAASGAKMAMRYLFNRGYRRIGMIQAPSEDSLDACERERVFREMLTEEGIELDPDHFKKCDYFFEEDGYLKTMEMIQTARTLPRALLCFNDDLAVGAIRALRDEKILVPQEVAVMGFDGTERGSFVNPPLTTISQPLEQMGREMVRMLSSLLEKGGSEPLQVRFDSQLVIRQSA